MVSACHVGFVVVMTMMVIFWDCTFPPLVGIREHPEFHALVELDKFSWPRCLLWHGWLPSLSGKNNFSPWAEDSAEGAGVSLWTGSCRWDAAAAAQRVAAEPDVWTDGSFVEDKVSGISS